MPRNNVSVKIDLDRRKINAETDRVGRRAVNETAEDIARVARRIVPVRSGATRDSIKVNRARISRGGERIAASVSAGGAAKYLMKGTRPHIIRARRAKALAFEWRGRQVFFRSVNHPGTRARPFLTIAAERVAARRRAMR